MHSESYGVPYLMHTAFVGVHDAGHERWSGSDACTRGITSATRRDFRRKMAAIESHYTIGLLTAKTVAGGLLYYYLRETW